jgi:aminopeptidase N
MLGAMVPRPAATVLAAVALAGALGACGKEPARPPVSARLSSDAGVAPALRSGPEPLGEASLMADIEWLTAPARRGRGSRSAEAAEVARWLAGELAQAGYTPVLQPIPAVEGQVNVVAVYGPREEGARTMLVTAHYDHMGEIDGVIHPGADDNASGVAVALAVARDLAARRDVRGRVIFAFLGAEEIGLLGARAYADAPIHPLAETRAVLNLDMVGRRFFEATIGADAMLGAVGLPDDSDLFGEASAVAAELGLELIAVSPLLLALVGEDWRSDDWVFRELGVPAVHLSTGLHGDYHRPSDTADRLSRPQLMRIARFLRALLARTATRDDRP